jgi:hypothetical protein
MLVGFRAEAWMVHKFKVRELWKEVYGFSAISNPKPGDPAEN